jgi:phosphate transport system substrate-binding protein
MVGAACVGESGETGSGSGVELTGAGASFPYPLYSKWSSVYMNETGARINYQNVGSGAGINQILEGTVDFGASDGPMTDEELARSESGPILHIPTTVGAVVVVYNLAGVTDTLQMSPDVIADIFLGKITRWNDPRLAAINAGVTLPNAAILVVHRSDGSGTTYIFTDYLSKVSPAWRGGPGRGKAVAWPVGLGAAQNDGVSAQVKQTVGAVGYVELAYATQNRLPAARIRNSTGTFVSPSIESITAAAAGVADTLSESSDFRVSIVNSPATNAYPISSLTWILIHQQQRDATKGRAVVDFLGWAVTDGQQYGPPLHYAPLPARVVSSVQTKLAGVTFPP